MFLLRSTNYSNKQFRATRLGTVKTKALSRVQGLPLLDSPCSSLAETLGSPLAFQAALLCNQQAQTAVTAKAGLQVETVRDICPSKKFNLNKMLLEALILAFKNLLLA